MRTTLRQLARLAALAVISGAILLLGAIAASASTWADVEESLAAKVNGDRVAAGLPPLTVDTQLVRVARGWSATMSRDDSLKHNSALGQQVQGSWTRLGENVGVAVRGTDTLERLAERLHEKFVESAPHRENMRGDFDSLGVGVVVTDQKLWVTINFMKGARPDEDATPQVDEALRVSRSVFGSSGSDLGLPAQFAIVARAEVFADALSGSALAGQDAPILFTPGPRAIDPDPVLLPGTRAEIDRLLGGSGVVYLLGGPGAVSARAESELRAGGYTVRRLSGTTRVETSVAVAREVLARRGSSQEVLIARADDWADAVSGGAYAAYSGAPLLLTTKDELHHAVAGFLVQMKPERRWALGGQAALGEQVVTAAGAQRVSGADRAATSVAIAEQLWGRTAATSGDRYVTTPGFDRRGWAYALAFAPWSAAHRGPQLLVGDQVPASVESYLGRLGYSGAKAGSVESAAAVPRTVVDRVRHLLGS